MTKDGLRASLVAEIAQLEAWTPRMPPSMRAEGNRMIAWARELIQCVDAGRADDAEELLESAKHFDPWLQDYAAFCSLIESGAVVADDDAGTVTLRWDLVPTEHRKVAASLATELVDGYRGRSAGGWPKGKARSSN